MSEYICNAVVSYREDINDELAIFKVKPDNWDLPEYESGQYAELAFPDIDPTKKLERRSYSIASNPTIKNELEFYIVRVEGGFFTPQLWELQVGDRLWLGPKIKGKFTLEEVPAGKDLVMVATGTGLAPFMSMLRNNAENPKWRNVVLVHGSRYEKDLGYREELKELEKKYNWFRYMPSLTREPEGSSWDGKRGRVQKLFEDGSIEEFFKEKMEEKNAHILICGNPQMIDDLQALLESKGLNLHKKKNPGNIHVERYW